MHHVVVGSKRLFKPVGIQLAKDGWNVLLGEWMKGRSLRLPLMTTTQTCLTLMLERHLRQWEP